MFQGIPVFNLFFGKYIIPLGSIKYCAHINDTLSIVTRQGAKHPVEPNDLTIFNKVYNRLRCENSQLRQNGCFFFQVLVKNYCRVLRNQSD